jgi:uncharacterized protein YcbK (DUF882 family)
VQPGLYHRLAPSASTDIMPPKTDLARRRWLKSVGGSALALAPAWARAGAEPPRRLRLDNLHTGEKLAVDYFDGGRYQPDALAEVDRFLRDFRSGEVGVIDPALLDLLHRLASTTGSRQPYAVISGYRSAATNEALRRHSSGVASGSLHMRGQAIDIRLADVPLATLREAARSLRLGGVGYYPASDFVHVDTGRVRIW